MKKNILTVFIFILAFLSSCNKNIDYGIVSETKIDFKFIDKDSVNLLDNGTYSFDEMFLYYLIDGEKVKIFESLYDHPKFIYTFDLNNQTILRLRPSLSSSYKALMFSDIPEGYNETIAYLELNENETDTIRAEIYKNGQSCWLTKFWYNGTLYEDFRSDESPEKGVVIIVK